LYVAVLRSIVVSAMVHWREDYMGHGWTVSGEGAGCEPHTLRTSGPVTC
jgi:hypothetical protein